LGLGACYRCGASCTVPEVEYFSADVDRHDRLIEDGDAKYREAGRTGLGGSGSSVGEREVSQAEAEAASELGGRRPGATRCGGWKRDGGWLYEDLKNVRKEQEGLRFVTVVREKSKRVKEWSKFNIPSESN
jgi:hypothetical protein